MIKTTFIEQDHSKATYASKIQKSEGEINWNESASIIIGKINGYILCLVLFLFIMERDIKF